MTIVDPTQLWVNANIEETNVGQLKVGQTVTVHVDALNADIPGKVEAVTPATANTFSLLPSSNASGNFTKVTPAGARAHLGQPGQPAVAARRQRRSQDPRGGLSARHGRRQSAYLGRRQRFRASASRGLLHGLDYQWQVLMCAVVGTFMVMLDQTVVNIALPKITTVFGVGVHETQLVITSYMLALAVIMPATGFLSDTFGTKRLYLITMALFTGGSLLCGLAWNNPSLVAFRVIQGLGGGMMSPLGMTMLFQAVPPQRRNTIMGFFGLPLMLAPVLGPTLGGYLVEYIDWRVIFTLNVPIGMIGLFLGFTLLRESARVPGLKFDLRGFVLSAIGFSAMLLGLSDAATDGWTSPGVLARFAIGIVALAGWVWVELTDEHPAARPAAVQASRSSPFRPWSASCSPSACSAACCCCRCSCRTCAVWARPSRADPDHPGAADDDRHAAGRAAGRQGRRAGR